MSKVTNSSDIDRVPDDKKWRFTSILFQQIKDILNNGILLPDNFNGQIIECDFTAANTDTFFTHDLDRVTQYYIVLSLSANMVVYNGATANTVDGTYLRSSAIGTAFLMVI